MKKLISLLGLGLMISAAHGAECFTVSTCIKSVSLCETMGRKPSYFSSIGLLTRTAGFHYEVKENLECLQRNGKKTLIARSGVENNATRASVQVEEIRIPATLEEVSQSFIIKVNEEALGNCEDERTDTLNSYKLCE